MYSTIRAVPALALMCVVSIGCTTAEIVSKETPAETNQNAEIRTLMESMNDRMNALEAKISSLNDKTEATKNVVEAIAGVKKAKVTPVSSGPSDHVGVEVEAKKPISQPESGFINDNATKGFRQALILFETRKYPEAILAFSAFLEKNADHPLAGSAQYYVGESYFLQKEYRLAIQEFERILTSYDRSVHVADALERLAVCHQQIKNPEDAANYRKQLVSMFPNSNAAMKRETAVYSAPSSGHSEVESGEKQILKSGEQQSEHQIDTLKEKKEYSERIQQAINEVISKTNTAVLDEPPPPTAPVPQAKEAGSIESDAQHNE